MAMRGKLKVKTGCTTCKLRKVKCDEQRPFCNRCKTAGRQCVGFGTLEPTARATFVPEQAMVVYQNNLRARAKNILPRPTANIDCRLSLPVQLEESNWLHFFSTRTGPALTPFSADDAFWSSHVPRLGVSEPAVRHALVAAASFHERFETMAGTADASRTAISGSFTVKHYNRAIHELQQTIDNGTDKLEVPLVCCLLFVLLECLYGNYPLILAHLKNGLNILKLPEFLQTDNPETLLLRKKLQEIFTMLLAQSTLFGAPPVTSALQALRSERAIGPTPLEPFVDELDAKSSLETLAALSLHFVKSLHDESGERKWPGSVDDQPMHQSLKARLIAWKYRLEASESGVPQRIDPNSPLVIMLKIQQKSTFIYLSRSMEIGDSPFDVYRPDFVQLLDWCRTLNRTQPQTPSKTTALLSRAFSLDSGCVPALFLVAYKCRDPMLRREAITLLEANPCREGLWDAALHAKIARRVVELEECSMLLFEGAEYATMEEAPSTRMTTSNGATIANWPLERFRIYNIHRTSEDPACSARVTFFTAPNGYDEPRITWREDFKF